MSSLLLLPATFTGFAITHLACTRPMHPRQHGSSCDSETVIDQRTRQLCQDVELAHHQLDLRYAMTPVAAPTRRAE